MRARATWTVEDCGAHVRQAAREMAAHTFRDPDADWVSTLWLFGEDGLQLAMLDPMMESEEKKDALAATLPEIIRRARAKVAVLLLSAWLLRAARGDPFQKPSESPDREEILVVCAADATRQEEWSAPIYRDGEQPPALGQWECLSDGGEVGGRFSEALARAFSEDD